jgi:acetyl esterase
MEPLTGKTLPVQARDTGTDDAWDIFNLPVAIDPKVQAFNRMTAEALGLIEPVYAKPVATARHEREAWARQGAADDAVWLDVANTHHALRVRVLPTQQPKGIYFHAHGGGWVLGGPHHQDDLLHHVRDHAQLTVVSVEYRLAPEHPFPAALDDTEAALRWLLDGNAPIIGADGPVIAGGESAGANLIAAAMIRLRGHKNFTRLVGTCLHYGTFDLSGTPSLLSSKLGTAFLDAKLSAWFRDHYAPRELHRNPEVSPLYADLKALPPALILVGTEDPVLDDSLFMYARWRAAGNAAKLAILPGGLHGLLEWRTPLTRSGREILSTFLLETVR